MQGFEEMVQRLEPNKILIYGNMSKDFKCSHLNLLANEPQGRSPYGNKISELKNVPDIQWFEPYCNKWNKEERR